MNTLYILLFNTLFIVLSSSGKRKLIKISGRGGRGREGEGHTQIEMYAKMYKYSAL